MPLHCASYCFLNSPKYIALVGAQFQRHGTGEFETKIVDPSHPIMKGFVPFQHLGRDLRAHQAQRKGPPPAANARRGKSEEPWTWVRTEGKGRVFYTAYGHDARTWQEPELSRPDRARNSLGVGQGRGLRQPRPRSRPGLAPLPYEESPAEIPNYLAGPTMGHAGRGDPQDAKAAARRQSRSSTWSCRAGFEPRLFAAEPEIYKPLCMAWDHRGRLWIAESTDYPNIKRRDGQGRDRISILEDTNGDGRADSFKVFAEGLNIPTSLLCHDGGVIVLQAPDTLFLKDTDGDGKADLRKVLFTGWGIDDTHAGPSNLRLGAG